MTAAPSENEPTRAPFGSLAFWGLVFVILAGSFGLRMRAADQLYRDPARVAFNDLDTQRRLARLEALAEADRYPVAEVLDGFPDGTVGHWTKPFDWYLELLNPFVGPLAGKVAVGHEPAAIFAGPFLCVLAVGIVVFGAVRLLGPGPGLLAGAFYSLQYAIVGMFAVGNGDHQNLQHVFLLAFVVLWILGANGQAGRWAAVVSGCGLGLGMWVSTESMLLLLAWVAITGLTIVVPGLLRESRDLAVERWRWGALTATLLVAMAVEQEAFWAFQWDLVSWFQLYPVLVFGLFLIATRWLAPVLAALGALGVGVLLLYTLPGFHAALEGQLADFAVANVWLQNVVSEFRSSFDPGDGSFRFREGVRRFSWLLVTLPVALGLVGIGSWTARARFVLIAGTVATFAMAVHEAKLSHLFAVWFALALVAAGVVVRRRWIPDRAGVRRLATGGFVVLLLGLAALRMPGNTLPPRIALSDDVVRELCGYLAKQDGADAGAVLAPWELGAPVMYQAKWPVVASGYHRNIRGIHDVYRFYMAQPEDAAVVQEILGRRRVRFVVAWFDRRFLQSGEVVLADGRLFFDGRNYTRLATSSLFFRLRYSGNVPGFRLRYESRRRLRLGAGPEEPFFRLFEVVR